MPIISSSRAANHSYFSGFFVLLLSGGLVLMSSCEKKEATSGPESIGGENREPEFSNGALPEDVLKRASLSIFGGETARSSRRGTTMASTGGKYGPEGTEVYPVKFEGESMAFYFSQDEFGDWFYTHSGIEILVPVPTMEEIAATRDAAAQKQQEEGEPDQINGEANQNAAGDFESSTEQAESNIEPPSDLIVANAARSLDLTDEEQSFKRGETLESLGGGKVPAGTILYPIKFEGFPLPIYLSRDEFGDWRFSIGDNPKLIPVRNLLPPESEEAKQERLLKEKEEADEQRKLEAAKRQAAEAKNDKSRNEQAMSDKAGRLAEAKAELAALESRITTERQRFQQATDTINRLTNFKKTPVKEGSAAYHQCVEASRVIQEVEQKAPDMTAEKTKLVALIAELEKN